MSFTEVSFEKTQDLCGNIYDAVSPERVLDFSSNVNILKMPREVNKAIKGCDLSRYPDAGCKKAYKNLSSRHGVGEECVVMDNGVRSLLNLTLKSLRVRSATVVMPCETEYKNICRMNTCDILPYVLPERQNYKLDCESFVEAITTRSDAVVMSNPCNATGRIISKNDMNTILDYCQSKGIYVIVDETYMDFALNDQSCVPLLEKYHNLVVLRSPSEYYNLAGVGAAYAIASKEIVELIKENQLPRQLDALGNALCASAYNNEKYDLKTKKWIFENKNYFVKKLKEIKDVRVIHSDCHFMLVSLGEVSATTVYNRLLKSNILIRDASAFTGLDGSYIRVAVKDKKSIDKFIEELMRCLV